MKKINLFIIGFIVIMLSASVNAKHLDVDLISQDPDPASAGEIVELRFSISNLDTEFTNDLDLSLNLGYPFGSVFGEEYTKSIGILQGYQVGIESKILKYKVKVDKSALADSYPLTIIIGDEESEIYIEKDILIDVENRDSAEIIYIDTQEINPGNTTSVEFTINNVGTSPLRNLVFSWENEDGVILPVGTSSQRFIKYLEIEGEYKIKYDVIADSEADPGLYKLDLNLEYYDSLTNETKVISTNAGLYVGGGTNFDIAFSEVENNEYSFTVANIGSNSANSVSVKIPEQEGLSFSGSNEDIIGNLEKGDYTIVSFNIVSTKPTIDLEVEYTDTKGQRKTINKTISVSSETSLTTTSTEVSKENFEETPGDQKGIRGTKMETGVSKLINWAKVLGVAIIVLIIIIIVYKHYKKKK